MSPTESPIIPRLLECNIYHRTNMATGFSMAARVALTVLKPAATHYSRQRRSVTIPHRFCHRACSSLYEHVREGYSDKPELDMTAVCEQTDRVIANVESRRGDLRGEDVRNIVSVQRA